MASRGRSSGGKRRRCKAKSNALQPEANVSSSVDNAFLEVGLLTAANILGNKGGESSSLEDLSSMASLSSANDQLSKSLEKLLGSEFASITDAPDVAEGVANAEVTG